MVDRDIDLRARLPLNRGMVDSLTVQLGARSYPIYFDGSLKQAVRDCVEGLRTAGREVAVVTDRHVAEFQGPALDAMFGGCPRLVLAPGEESKSLPVLGTVWAHLAERRIGRFGVLFAVGGGVIGDLAGFAAATYLRGIDFQQVPTTLLAMVDSSVGGKTGLNLEAGKNLVGAFHQPRAVYIATDLLATLPPREFAAGMAEVIKYALLGDAGLFDQLEQAPLTSGSPELAAVIRRCCALKAAIVEADERELAVEGGRALLNLGHTFGHAIEQVTGYGAYLHGEAVAIGLVAAARLSHKIGAIDGESVARIERVLAAHQLPVQLKEPLPLERLITAMGRDKKVRAGVLRFVILRKIGQAETHGTINPALAEAAFREIGAK